MSQLNIDRLREELFLAMLRPYGKELPQVSTEEATLLGEHAGRLAKAALDGMGWFDRTGEVRSPRKPGERTR